MKKYLCLVLFLIIISVGYSQNTSEFFNKTDEFLSAHVKNGRVDYKTIKQDPSKLNSLLEMADKIEVFKDNPKEYQAFWINGYNLLVIQGIIENYPLKSPLDIGGFFDKAEHSIGGQKITLNDIENKLLRGSFPTEPRFHFVLVCGGLGCPPIIQEVYLPKTIDNQLGTQTKKALNDSSFIQVGKNKVMVSQIFEWYKDDFTKNGQSIIDFINQYRTVLIPENTKVSFYPYDWTLNELN